MESKDKVELLQIAIKQLIEEEKAKTMKISSSSDESFVAAVPGDEDDADNHRLLSKLLSQLEMLKEDGNGMLEGTKQSADIDEVESPEIGEKSEATKEAIRSNSEIGEEEIVRELKEVKRQNFITHCLLSALIVVTVAWQLSEVSLILKVKEGLSNPFKALGGMVTGMLKRHRVTGGQEVDKLASAVKQKPLLAASSLPGLKIPTLPHVELPVFDFDSSDDD